MNEQNTNDYTGKAGVNQQGNQNQNPEQNKPETRPEQDPRKTTLLNLNVGTLDKMILRGKTLSGMNL